MTHEIEIKIAFNARGETVLRAWLASLFANQTASLHAHHTQQLSNVYFDSADCYLGRNQMGFRVRGVDQAFEMTLKTQGTIENGVHARPEFNLPLASAEPDWARLVAHFGLDLPADLTLLPQFRTDFQRESWQFDFGESVIEAALDLGAVENAFFRDPIAELELELKSGEVADLARLIERLPAAEGIWFSDASKAARGYFNGDFRALEIEAATGVKREALLRLIGSEMTLFDPAQAEAKAELAAQYEKAISELRCACHFSAQRHALTASLHSL